MIWSFKYPQGVPEGVKGIQGDAVSFWPLHAAGKSLIVIVQAQAAPNQVPRAPLLLRPRALL